MNLNFNNTTIVVLGDLILDIYISGKASRLSPEAPVPIIKKEKKWSVLGGAANVAANIKSLGGNCQLHGFVGSKVNAIALKQKLDEIECEHFLVSTDNPTITKTRILANNYQMCRVDNENFFESDICYEKNINYSLVNGVIFSDYNKGTLKDGTQSIITSCNKLKIPTFVDTKDLNFEKYIGVQFVILNEKEVIKLADKYSSCLDLKNAIKLVYEMFNCKYLVVTRGKNPVILFTKDIFNEFPVPDIPVSDVSGAGDTFLSAFALSYLSNNTIEESIKFGINAASTKVQKLGTSTVSISELTFP